MDEFAIDLATELPDSNVAVYGEVIEESSTAKEDKAAGSSWKWGLSIVLDFVPVVGQLKSAVEVVTGKDPVTGEPVSRWIALLGVVPVGKLGGTALKALRNTSKAAKEAKTVQKSLIKVVDDLQLPASLKGESKAMIKRAEQDLLKKKAALKEAIKSGKVGRAELLEGSSHVRKEATKRRKELKKAIDKMPDAQTRANMHARLKKFQVDHAHELQWGGLDQRNNLILINGKVNGSVGSQLSKATPKLMETMEKAAAVRATTTTLEKASQQGVAVGLDGAISYLKKQDTSDALTADNDALLSEIDTSLQEVDTACAQTDAALAEATTAEETARQKVEEAKEDEATAKQGLQQEKKTLADIQSKVDDLNRKMQAAKDDALAARLQDQLDDEMARKKLCSTRVGKCKQRLDRATTNRKTATQRLGTCTKTTKDLNQQLSALSRQRVQLHAKRQSVASKPQTRPAFK